MERKNSNAIKVKDSFNWNFLKRKENIKTIVL